MKSQGIKKCYSCSPAKPNVRAISILICLILIISSISLFLALNYIFDAENNYTVPLDIYLNECKEELRVERAKTRTQNNDQEKMFQDLYGPIDVVYTWVNGSDPKQIEDIKKFQRSYGIDRICNSGEDPDTEKCIEAAERRFTDHDELLYSLRGLSQNAPWVRNIYIVTNGQVPRWLDTSHPKIKVVTHEQIFKWTEHLPTFSSSAIEVHIHRIPGLSNRFLYLNDDMIIVRKVDPSTFWNPNDGQKIWLHWSVPWDPSLPKPIAPTPKPGDEYVCPQCICPNGVFDCEKAGYMLKPDRLSPYNTKIISHPPPVLPSKHEIDTKTASNSGRDYLYEESYPWENMKDDSKNARGTRKLMANDAVGQSLKKSNRLMHEEFGYLDRFEPAHAPLLIQKDVMERLQNRWPNEFKLTSSHRFRNPKDLYYSFVYTYFLMHERAEFDLDSTFSEADNDKSLVLEKGELHQLAARVRIAIWRQQRPHTSPPLATNFEKEFISNCTGLRPTRENNPFLTKTEFMSCSSVIEQLKQWKATQLRNKFNLGSAYSDSAFIMVGSNQHLARDLDFTLYRTTKFICLNDDIDYSKPTAAEYVKLLADFYKTLFPLPSPYELPQGMENKVLYVSS